MGISRRLRYEVLRRDDYTCQYCGAKAPDVQLNVDAVVPEALGGSHKDPTNLTTACEACNGGKTSSSPDAPLVAKVSADALRWSRAMVEAAARMRAEFAERQDVYDQFEAWWGNWNYGFKKELLPRPDDWRNSIDSFLAAGLPLDVLQWCVNKAMASKATPEATWRYMCGIAWKKVTELQEAAKGIAGGSPTVTPGETEDSPALERGRADWAAELLEELDDEEVAQLKAEAREDRGAVTGEQQDIEAVNIAWQAAHMSRDWLAYSVCDLLRAIPGDVIQAAMREARSELYDEHGPEFSRTAFAERAMSCAERGYRELRDAEYLAAMPEEERSEWIEYANAAFGNGRELAGRAAVIYPASCARGIKEKGRLFRGMCLARGVNIERCPTRAAFYVRFAEFDCCEDSDDGHEDHIFCESHTELAVAGELKRYGTPVTVTGYKVIPEADLAEMAVPF